MSVTTDRKSFILDQAMDLVVTDGLDALTMSKVARRVGFTEPAMYRHFDNKQDLIIQLIHRLDDGFETIFRRLSFDEPPEIFFPACFDALLGYLRRVRGVTFQFLSASTYNHDQRIRRELMTLFQGQLDRITAYLRSAAARKELRPGIDPEATALCFLGAIQALVTRSLLMSWHAGTRDVSRNTLDAFMKGVVG